MPGAVVEVAAGIGRADTLWTPTKRPLNASSNEGNITDELVGALLMPSREWLPFELPVRSADIAPTAEGLGEAPTGEAFEASPSSSSDPYPANNCREDDIVETK
jgi:hypothetical protein